MNSVVPPSLLFRYALPVRQLKSLPPPAKARRIPSLTERYSLPDIASLNGSVRFGDVRVAWNPKGLAIAVVVAGRSAPLACNPDAPTESDGLQIWLDTRNTQTIHRATRFCHQFCLLPARETGPAEQPWAGQVEIARAREQVLCSNDDIRIASVARADGYALQAWLPAAVLTGFEPGTSPQLGFYYHLKDSELGDQFLSVGDDFPFASDPSLWATLDLQD